MNINKKTYDFILNTSIFGLGISFIYYSFIIDIYPVIQKIIDSVYYLCLMLFITMVLLKIFSRSLKTTQLYDF